MVLILSLGRTVEHHDGCKLVDSILFAAGGRQVPDIYQAVAEFVKQRLDDSVLDHLIHKGLVFEIVLNSLSNWSISS
jgi:hypothetical protein